MEEQAGWGIPFTDLALADIVSAILSRKIKAKHPAPCAGAAERTKLWNATNPNRKRENDRKWAQKNGANASKRYRLKKKGLI